MNVTVPKEALEFFKELEKNNNRDWFNTRKKEFKSIEAQVREVYNSIYEALNTHDDIDRMKMFRVYRDIRFSKNKDPYKTHFGGSFHRTKPRLRGGYYLHIAPNNGSFIATGFWEPHKDDLFRIRKEFEMDDSEMRSILSDGTFKATWGDLVGDEVKTAPKGFNKEHKAIDLIKKKQFIFIRKYTDKQVLAPDFISDVNRAFKTIRLYFDYMSDVLTTDLNGESLI
jgi:uncharacterized protein (TIGR02453 family)